VVEDVSDSVAQVGSGCCVGADGIGCLFCGGDVIGGDGLFGSGAKGKAFGEEVIWGWVRVIVDWLYSQRSLGLGVAMGGRVGGLGVMRRVIFFCDGL
jgi:hypothetical protein